MSAEAVLSELAKSWASFALLIAVESQRIKNAGESLAQAFLVLDAEEESQRGP